MDENERLNKIRAMKDVLNMTRFVQHYVLNTYGFSNRPDIKESMRKQNEAFDKAIAAIDGIADIVEAEIIYKNLLSELGIKRPVS